MVANSRQPVTMALVGMAMVIAALASTVGAAGPSASRFLPRSSRSSRVGSLNRQRLDAMLNAELDALEKQLNEEANVDLVRDLAELRNEGRKPGDSHKRGDGATPDGQVGERTKNSPRVNGLTDTVSRLVDEIELSKLREAALEDKLSKLETRFEEESLAKALLLAKVPAMFETDRSGTALLEMVKDEEPLITKGDVTDYCHFNSLKLCGLKALQELGKQAEVPHAFMKDSNAVQMKSESGNGNELPIWERCQIKDDFLSCMIAQKHEPCEPNSKATLSRKALHEFRRILMKALQQAKGCWLPK